MKIFKFLFCVFLVSCTKTSSPDSSCKKDLHSDTLMCRNGLKIYIINSDKALDETLKADDVYIAFTPGGTLHTVRIVNRKEEHVYHFNSSGYLTHSYLYKNNRFNGPAIFYYPTGVVERIEYWKDGESAGKWVHYNKAGREK